jgi:hypothetical protein
LDRGATATGKVSQKTSTNWLVIMDFSEKCYVVGHWDFMITVGWSPKHNLLRKSMEKTWKKHANKRYSRPFSMRLSFHCIFEIIVINIMCDQLRRPEFRWPNLAAGAEIQGPMGHHEPECCPKFSKSEGPEKMALLPQCPHGTAT